MNKNRDAFCEKFYENKIEKLKCCGNCKYYMGFSTRDGLDMICDKDHYEINSATSVCKDWEIRKE
jgi:acetyl-CoA carboxylase beta subunit